MIKVLLVDDEPFIRQGLRVLVDWEEYGYQVVGEAENGKEAIQILRAAKVDLVFVDMKMPEMSGLELISYIQSYISNKIRFVILTGYADFAYARQAIQLKVREYIVKPIVREDLIRVLEEMAEEFREEARIKEQELMHERMEYHDQVTHIILGKYREEEYESVVYWLSEEDNWQYVSFEYSLQDENFCMLDREAKIDLQRKCVIYLEGVLKEDDHHVISAVEQDDQIFGVGLLFTPNLAEKRNMDSMTYIAWLQKRIQQYFGYQIQVYLGTKVDSLRKIGESYHSIWAARCLYRFSEEKDPIAASQEEKSLGRPVESAGMDYLIDCIKQNQPEQIEQAVEKIYVDMKENAMSLEMLNANIYHLLYQLIKLARELDDETNQEEVLRYISKESFEEIALSGNENELTRFVLDYADYLSQLRSGETRGVLEKVIGYVREHYQEKLSLKILGEKFYINNVYLGQLFKKKYGVTFKDYLNEIRLEEAVKLLKETDKRIYTIAEEVGFANADYFINKFVQKQGITPFQYRKRNREEG